MFFQYPPLTHYYRPQRSCGKVMFLHVSVILFVGGLCPSMHHRSHDQKGGLCPAGSLSRGMYVQGVSVRGVYVWGVSVQRGLCLGGCLSRGLCLGDLCPGGYLSGRLSVQGSLSGGSLSRGLCPGGSLSRGSMLGTTHRQRHHPYGNKRAVGILLECILV